MPRRYLPRLRRNKTAATIETQALNNLQRQADTLIAQLTRQLTEQLVALQKEASDSLAKGGSGSDGISSAQAKLFFSALNYITSIPRVKTTQAESQRSINANAEFRLSHSQMMVEAASALQNGDKNR